LHPGDLQRLLRRLEHLASDAARTASPRGDLAELLLVPARKRSDVGRGKITEVQETQARYDSVLAKEVSESGLRLRAVRRPGPNFRVAVHS
jgi:outer membrane protein TolC